MTITEKEEHSHLKKVMEEMIEGTRPYSKELVDRYNELCRKPH